MISFRVGSQIRISKAAMQTVLVRFALVAVATVLIAQAFGAVQEGNVFPEGLVVGDEGSSECSTPGTLHMVDGVLVMCSSTGWKTIQLASGVVNSSDVLGLLASMQERIDELSRLDTEAPTITLVNGGTLTKAVPGSLTLEEVVESVTDNVDTTATASFITNVEGLSTAVLDAYSIYVESVDKAGNRREAIADVTLESAVGHYGRPSVDIATACPSGEYQDVEGERSCKPCPAGSFATDIGASSSSVCSAAAQGSFSADVLISENFEDSSMSGWTFRNGAGTTFGGSVTTCGYNDNKILGGYNVIASGTLSKTFTLPAGSYTSVIVDFDFVKIDSWDSETFVVRIDGEQVHSQVLSHQIGHPQLCGSTTAGWTEQFVRISTIVRDKRPGETVFVEVQTFLSSSADDESFGIDNFRILKGATETAACTGMLVSSDAGSSECSCCPENYVPNQSNTGCTPCANGFSTLGQTCTTCATTCGDGLRAGTEGCDDGNTVNGDGCSSTCAVEPSYSCSGGSPTSQDTCTCGTAGTCTLYDLDWSGFSAGQQDTTWTASGQYSSREVTTCGSIGNVLGGFNKLSVGSLTRTFTILPQHTSLHVSFGILKLDSWDSEVMRVYVDGSEVWSQVFVGNAGSQQCGSANAGWHENLVTDTVIVPHTGSSVTVAFQGFCNSAPSDESWGLHDLQISV